MTLKILTEETINKIAAGEVIERPANIVKELLENAIDALSTHIYVELKGAGKQLIRVRDNGTGMTREDIPLAVTRHATSKISVFSDLEKLSTMGFRGEALPSIASISHMHIQSQLPSTTLGWEEKYAAGERKESKAWAGSPGTSVEVSNLFFNVPARKKFLKSDQTERYQCIKTIEEITLAHPEIAFTVVSETRTTLATPRTKNTLERLTDVLGDGFTHDLLPIAVDHQKIKLTAYITKTEQSLPNKNFQFLFVNKRPVKYSKSLMHSIYEAYREHLLPGRHPGIIIYIDINPAEIDVNIHPTKKEIKFSNEREIHDLLYRALKDALIRPIEISLDTPDIMNRNTQTPVRYSKETYQQCTYTPKNTAPSSYTHASSLSTQPVLEVHEDSDSTAHILGQAFNLYLIAQEKDMLLIIDQHAAAERIRYEKYKDEWERKNITIQPLLLPLTIEVPSSHFSLITENQDILHEAGWEIHEFGSNTLRITAQPHVLGTSTEIKEVLNTIITALAEERSLPKTERLDALIRAACRASIKANEYLSPTEIKQLYKDLQKCKSPYTCPHGRPTMIKLSKNELSKKFKRT